MDKKNNNFMSREDRAILLDSVNINQCPPWFRQFIRENPRITNGLVDSLEPAQREYLRNRSPSLVTAAGGEWVPDPSKRHIDLGPDENTWRRCSLSNTKIRHVFFIMNEFNGKQKQVGCECVNHFNRVRGGRSIAQHRKAMERQRLLDNVEAEFPGIERLADQWNVRLEGYPMVISFALERKYLALRTRLRQVIEDYINGKCADFHEIGEILGERQTVLAEIEGHVSKNKNMKYAAGQDISKWLIARGKSRVLRAIKQEDGLITKTTAPLILEPGFMRLIEFDLRKVLKTIGAELVTTDLRRGTYIVGLNHNKKILLDVPHGRLVAYCGDLIFADENTAYAASTLEIENILSFSSVPRNEIAVSDFIGQLQIRVRFTRAPIIGHSFKYMDILIYEKASGKYIVTNIEPFLKGFIELALGINTPRNARTYEHFVETANGRRYTKDEIGARFERYARAVGASQPVS